VEYELQGINQVHVKPAIGLTFAEGLRCILRQDPDVIMVGEIRDKETATMAVRAALTGHLVLSTIHTNSAVATINRLRNIGVESFLLGSCLTLVLAQRLVRRICPDCKAPYSVPDSLRERLGLSADVTCYHGEGCSRCNRTGYYGRLALFEMLAIDRELGTMISENDEEDVLLAAARAKGFRTLRESGVACIRDAVTTPEEVIARTME
jgi:type II secretory ATPase GspE/PulE/Tfp pilus assembly ATPase PilB-like protein